MPECPICDRELDWRGSNSYKKHIQESHRLYWLKARRLTRLATSTLIISLILTFLVATVFYSPDAMGYSVMGLAALFLAFSTAFTLKERALTKRHGKGIKQEKKKRVRKRSRASQFD
nr:hypothetical protein [Candidatus Njordarchaeota archaeon]